MIHGKALPIVLILIFAASIANLSWADSDAPLSIGGFTLGTPIETYNLEPEDNYIEEVIISDLPGFRKGFITYGLCEKPGEIIRIKLKYEDRSYDFYNKLLEHFNKRFSSKPRFEGDSFGRVKAWKWSFSNSQGELVSLALQHNLKDADESIGNMVKLSMPDRFIAERNCSNKSSPESEKKQGLTVDDWSIFLPK